jgi:hypothetical protein
MGEMARGLNWKAELTGVETTLSRPIGEIAVELTGESGRHAFPPRLPEQPFFRPVLNEVHRNQIARSWSTRRWGIGYVTNFKVDSESLRQFPLQRAGTRIPQQSWIRAEELEEFNRHIVGSIKRLRPFRSTQPKQEEIFCA